MPEKSTMQEAVGSIFARLGKMRQCDDCPICGEPMYVFVNPETGKDRSMPACMACGHKEARKDAPTNESESTNWQLKANKADALGYMRHSSVITDPDVYNKKFSNFITRTKEQKEAKAVAKRVVDDMMTGETVHAIFTGPTGTGKSHLAMACLWEVLERSWFKQHVMFVDFRELLTKTKQGFHDDAAFKQYSQFVADEIQKADVVVIDDLGSEAGDDVGSYQSSQYNMDVSTRIFQGRANKNTIVTTNRSGKELKKIYGSRVISRMSAHTQNHVMLFEGMPDHRLEGMKA